MSQVTADPELLPIEKSTIGPVMYLANMCILQRYVRNAIHNRYKIDVL
jgi:hypothetical protein